MWREKDKEECVYYASIYDIVKGSQNCINLLIGVQEDFVRVVIGILLCTGEVDGGEWGGRWKSRGVAEIGGMSFSHLVYQFAT